jgi:hypothetical protein
MMTISFRIFTTRYDRQAGTIRTISAGTGSQYCSMVVGTTVPTLTLVIFTFVADLMFVLLIWDLISVRCSVEMFVLPDAPALEFAAPPEPAPAPFDPAAPLPLRC